MARILIVDDERPIRNTLREILEFEDYAVEEAVDGEEAVRRLPEGGIDVCLCDVKMPKKDGLEVLEAAAELNDPPQFIMISGHGNIETAVEATKKGAFDFIEKPPDLNRLLVSIRNALDKNTLVAETKVLRRKVSKTNDILGESEATKEIKQTIETIAPTEARVLITGSNGTGKELVARWVHELSPRQEAPFVEVNCAAIPKELIESELFGHEKGAFTGAHKQRIGKFEQAQGGTLFLDEIGDMSLEAQSKVLRALQEHRISRVGSDKDIKVDVRVLAATNKDLLDEIDAHRFREDLYHRLSVILIHVPPLRERPDDIPVLAEAFLQEICRDYGFPPKQIEPEAMAALQQLEWTGNVRELRNVMERLAIFCGERVRPADVQTYAVPRQRRRSSTAAALAGEGPDLNQYSKLSAYKDEAERSFILSKLRKNGWNISKTAEEIDIQRSHLYNKIEKYNLSREKPVS